MRLVEHRPCHQEEGEPDPVSPEIFKSGWGERQGVGNPRTRRAVHRPPACVRVGCPGPLADGGGAPPPWTPQGAIFQPVLRTE